jgi:putative transposase
VVSQEDRELALENERLRRENRILREEGQEMIRGIISPTTHRQRSHVQHRSAPAGPRLHCGWAEPEPKVRAAKWAGDISYVWTREGWLYPAVILDLHSRRVIALRVLHAKPLRVIAWAVSNRMKRDLAIRALKMAIHCPAGECMHSPRGALRSPPSGCIFHIDRGSQYCSHDYQKILREHCFKASMSGKGNCYDNAAVEAFFKTIKAELIWRRFWETRRQAETAIAQYINAFHHPRRRPSALGGKSPLAFKRQVA